jgi:RNA methyltransferase, TrmH family
MRRHPRDKRDRTQSRQKPKQRPPVHDEFKVSGLRAVSALFATAPQRIQRLFLVKEMSREARPITEALARERKPFRQVDAAELQRIAATMHHGGIVATIDPPTLKIPTAADIEAWAAAKAPILVLDGVSNPHNFGAILRTAAFLGVRHVVLSERKEQALPSEAAYRVAEGGMEHVTLYRPAALATFCRNLSTRFRVVAASPRGTALGRLPPDSRPPAIVLGNEETGLDPSVARACDNLVAIAGSGAVESLNVSVAAGILMHALFKAPDTGR